MAHDDRRYAIVFIFAGAASKLQLDCRIGTV
jgi:hypothetical protein